MEAFNAPDYVTNRCAENQQSQSRILTDTFTLWIVRHEAQLLINRINNKFGHEEAPKSFFFWAKNSAVISINFTNTWEILRRKI